MSAGTCTRAAQDALELGWDLAEEWDDLEELEDLPTCEWCGQPRVMDLVEVWPTERAWLFDTCCEAFHQVLVEDLNHALDLPPMERRRFLEPLRELFTEYGIDVRQVFDDQLGGVRLDYGVELERAGRKGSGRLTQTEAKEFIREHHRHNPPPAGWKYGMGIYNGPEVVGVAWVGRPVSRVLQSRGYLEVNRLCVREDVAPELVWNACSKAYGAIAREAKRERYPVITYTMEDEDATTLRAAGWVPEAMTSGGSWSCPSRPREDKAPTCRKVRWAPAWCAQPEESAAHLR